MLPPAPRDRQGSRRPPAAKIAPRVPPTSLELVLFAAEPELVEAALAAGIGSFIVDWEWRGKSLRQAGADTEINRQGTAELERLAALGAPRRFCRVNRSGPWTAEEIERALGAGATHLFLPMVEDPREVEEAAERIAGRARLGVLVETVAGVRRAAEIAAAGPERVYVGLNDLAISRGGGSIFGAVADGTVEAVRRRFPEALFGFGGVTVVDRGEPVPCRLLLGEMARLDCGFSFMRRSFRRDVAGRDLSREVRRIERLWRALRGRPPAAVEHHRRRFACAVRESAGEAAPRP